MPKTKQNEKKKQAPKKESVQKVALPALKELVRRAKVAARDMTSLDAERKRRLMSYVDSKDSKADVSSLETALANTKQSLADVKSLVNQSIGLKEVPITIAIEAAFSTTVTTGVVATPLTVNVTSSAEWASIAVLFDEYRVCGGWYDFAVVVPTARTTLGGTVATYPLLAMGYDPSDATVASSTAQIAELAQHHLFAPQWRQEPGGGTATTSEGYFGRADNKPLRFEFSLGKVQQINPAAGTSGFPGMWRPTTTGAPIDGYIRPFWQSGDVTVKAAITGVLYVRVLVRSRT